MRNELEQIQRIDQYLLGEIQGPEKVSFEMEMHSNKEFSDQVELQKQLMKGIKRTQWREDATKAYGKYQIKQSVAKLGMIGAGTITLIGLTFLLTKGDSTTQENKQPGTVITPANDSIKADSLSIYDVLKGNTFVINSSRDTVVETTDGTLVEIPKTLFNDSIPDFRDSVVYKKQTEGSQAKIYTLHFYTPSYKDSLKKWKQSIQEKNYSKTFRSVVSSANPKNYFKTSSKKHETIPERVSSKGDSDTIYKAAIGLNMEKMDDDLRSKNSKLYKLKGKIPFVNKASRYKNTILVFDIDNRNKSSIDTAIVIEIVDKLKQKSIISKPNKK
ncbi:MAG: hypothetical protein K0R26_101 [Bacteroidota bacterium]|jgi:hypothetical protein|nr:hypothetical protein [Bacteroidota bacterium]